ncbi:MAG: hypothetical protein QOI87_2888, partial [Bradyrhizobium sp.]|nr:hypothetical protein [Bradyrhizobium sp.]
GVPVREFLRTLQPPPSDGDKIDIRFDKFRQGRRIMSVPGILPTGYDLPNMLVNLWE